MNLEKQYFITGGSGFIGFHLHRLFGDNNIVNFDITEPTFDYSSVFFKGDICKYADIDAALDLNKCDTIIHLAAKHGDFSISEAEYFRVNEFGMAQIIKAATKHAIKQIIFFSSVAVYGNNLEPSTELTPPNPNNPYGASKLAAEKLLTAWAAADAARCAVIIRPAYVYGERNFANMYRLLQMIESNRYVHIGSKPVIKSIAYVENLALAVQFLIERMTHGITIYNYADEPQIASHDIAEYFAKYLGKRKIRTVPYFLVYPFAMAFDLLSRLTGRDYSINVARLDKFLTATHHTSVRFKAEKFEPIYDNQEGLRRMAYWYLNRNIKSEAIPKKTVVAL